MSSGLEIRTLRRHAPLVLVCVLGGLLSAALVAWRTAPTYSSSTTLFLSTTHTANAGNVYEQALFAQARVKSYIPLVTSPDVMTQVATSSGTGRSADALAREVSVTAPPDTVLLKIVVHDGSAEDAKAIATATATAFMTFVTRLEGNDGGVPTVQVSVIKPAELSTRPVSPRPALDVTLGVVAGALLGIGLAALRHQWTDAEGDAGSKSANNAASNGASATPTRGGRSPAARGGYLETEGRPLAHGQ